MVYMTGLQEWKRNDDVTVPLQDYVNDEDAREDQNWRLGGRKSSMVKERTKKPFELQKRNIIFLKFTG